ncbi:MAG TPA: hypothetical protein DEQ34_09725 [Balneolaceae bacterium]|nr:hypothetical protein [Balneolaceae bacterium]|tara:strand:- start:90257 stop:90601 length:345 start_codon:yes stop_codon:yes gene_type:complete
MTSNTLSKTTRSPKLTSGSFVTPILDRIKKESADEYFEMQQAFNLMGWGKLPDSLKIEIYEDVRFMVQELKGLYSSCDQYIKRRRETVHFWVSSYQDGICSLDAAIKGVKIPKL